MDRNSLLERIQSRGYWDVTIRPLDFLESRVGFEDLKPVVEHARVSLRGWSFPAWADGRDEQLVGMDWIEGGVDFADFKEVWRFSQSGQFQTLRAFAVDWSRDQNAFSSAEGDWHGQWFPVMDTIFFLTEVTRFASNLAANIASNETIEIGFSACNLKGRRLWMESPRRYIRDYKASMSEFRSPKNYPKSTYNKITTAELDISRDEIAASYAVEIFARFGLKIGVDIVRDIQSELSR